jgi:MFS family permease
MTASFMQTLLIPIQSRLPQILDAPREETAWAVTITLLVSAVCTPISGRLGDMYGKRRIALVLMGVLVLGSVICAISYSAVPLIVGRGLQGAGMGVIPLGISILRDVLHPEKMGGAIALVSATLGVGGALGLPISAYITETADWHVLFWSAAILGVVVLVLMARVVPPSTLRTGGRVDLVGVAGLSVGLTGVLLAISKGADWGWTSAPTMGFGLGGIAVLVAWGVWERRVTDPLVDLVVNARGPVLMTNLASVAMGFALFAANIAYPQLLELPEEVGGLGLSLVQAGLILMPSGAMMLLMAPVAGRLLQSWGPKPLLITGALIIAVAYAISVWFTLGAWVVLGINILVGIGIGLGFAAMPTLVMRSVPASETAASNGFNTLMRGLGTTSAATAVAAILAQYTREVDGVPLPTLEGFRIAFVLGLACALASAVLAALIPRPTPRAGERPSLPEDAV